MRYRMHFISGASFVVDESHLLALSFVVGSPLFQVVAVEGKQVLTVNMNHITHVVPEETLEGVDGVVTPPSPDDIAEQKKKERDAKIANPDAILEGIKESQKNEDPNES